MAPNHHLPSSSSPSQLPAGNSSLPFSPVPCQAPSPPCQGRCLHSPRRRTVFTVVMSCRQKAYPILVATPDQSPGLSDGQHPRPPSDPQSPRPALCAPALLCPKASPWTHRWNLYCCLSRHALHLHGLPPLWWAHPCTRTTLGPISHACWPHGPQMLL